jgi:LPXTG-motif cell wall-anchored protein
MNVRVPGQGQIEAFWAVVGLMAVLLVGLVVLFRRRGIL